MMDLYGRTAYETYRASRAGKTHDDKDMPAWENLGPGIRAAWGEAAKAVITVREAEDG